MVPRAVNRKYPLETLRRARADEVDKRTRTYGEAVRREEEARAELGQKKAEHAALVSRIETQVHDERARLESGELSAADLVRGATFGLRADIEKKVSARKVDDARARHEGKRGEAQAKQAALGRASADAKVVEKNREAWAREEQRAAERAEEIAADEMHTSRSARKGNP
jgi:hypothetical protein